MDLEQQLAIDAGNIAGAEPSTAFEGADAPRDENGRFTAEEPSYGLESLENGMGYLRQDPLDTRVTADEDQLLRRMGEVYETFGGTEDAAVDLTIPMVATDADGNKLPDNASISVEAAGEQFMAVENELSSYVEGQALFDEFSKVDAMRAEAARTSSDEELKAMDLKRSEVETNAKLWQEDQQPEQPAEQPTAARPDQQQEYPAVEGLDPIAQKAINELPALRSYLEAQTAKAYEADQQLGRYVQAQAQGVMQQLNALLPDVAQYNMIEQRQQAFFNLQRTDPGRFQQAAALLQEAERINWAANQATQNTREAEQSRQQEYMRSFGRAEDAKVNVTAAEAEAVKEWAKEEFGSVEAYAELLATKPEYRDHRAQRTVIEAAKWRAAQKSAARPTRSAPTLSKPGTANTKSAREVSADQLAARFAHSGSVEDGFALYLARGGR